MPALGIGVGVALVVPPTKHLPRPPQGSVFVTTIQLGVQPVTSGGTRVTVRIS